MLLPSPAAGLTSALLLSLLSPLALAAPSFKHSRLHQQHAHSSNLKAAVSEDAANATAVKLGSGSLYNQQPVIFEHKHQRLFKAGPGDAVIREVYDTNAMAKRDVLVYVTKYETVCVDGTLPTGLPRFHLGAPHQGAPTGIGFIPFASLEASLAGSTAAEVNPAATTSSSSALVVSSSDIPSVSSISASPTSTSEAVLSSEIFSSSSSTKVVATTSGISSSAAVTTSLLVPSTSSSDAPDSTTDTDCDEPAKAATSVVEQTSAVQSDSVSLGSTEIAPVTTTAEASISSSSSKSSAATTTAESSTIAIPSSSAKSSAATTTAEASTTAISSSSSEISSSRSKSSAATTTATQAIFSASTQIAIPSSTDSGIMQSIVYASALSSPVAQGGQYLGYVSQEPVMEYIPHTNEEIPTLASDLLGSGINDLLITGYKLFNGSGSLVYKQADTTETLYQTPWMGRDNGKGGFLNGQQIFMYADTGVTILANDNAFGGFVSTSVAVDKGRLATQGKAPVLQDMMGEWDDSAAVPRGFVPFTLGEAAYTGQSGKRYAIWPESSLIYLDSQTALCYASIVYIDTNAESLFADVGNTLIKVTVPGIGGPVAHRPVPLLYGADELNYGVIGGIRSWGASGPGGSDGSVYVFANAGTAGLLLGRVGASQVEDKSAYEYFNNDTQSWSPTAPSKDGPAGFFVEGPYSNADIFYSPRHLTFIMVYQTPYADNNFWWRFLQTSTAIKPSYAGGSDDDIVENLHKYPWSDPELLFSAPKPGNGGYIYAGGVQMGYFDTDDIVNGGPKMLLQWTAPVAKDDPRGYDTGTAIVTFA